MNSKPKLPSLITEAIKKREFYEEKIVEYTAKIQEIDEFFDELEKNIEEFIRQRDEEKFKSPTGESSKTQIKLSMSISQAAEKILNEHGKPMKIKDMVSKLWENGYRRYETKQKLYTSLYTTMSRRKKFYRSKPGIFGLTEWKKRESTPS